jgi:CubicO group peptidase (beta-lactamase class C family)
MKKAIAVHLLILLLITACTSPGSLSVQVPEPDYWPTSSWRSSTPEAQGMDSELLARMLEDINANETSIHSVLIIRNGYLITEAYFHPYTRDTKINIQSVTKSVIGMLVGKAIGDKYIKSENEKLLDFYPGRVFENPSKQKNSIRLKHLLSMSSGLDCQEFSGSGPNMEQSQGWVQFMLDRPMTAAPGKVFGYCNGNAHLLSSILEKTTGMSAREYANQELFEPLGVSPADEADWWNDPQQITIGGYGLHLTPVDIAKLAFLNLHNGKWEDRQIIPSQWMADSTTQYVQKEDGSGYGYLWTVYPEGGHYAALGLGGQQIHVYPSRNLIMIVTASLESYAEAPEVEKMLHECILPAVQSNDPLPENPDGYKRLQTELETAANPVHLVPGLPAVALDISNRPYTFAENLFGWQTLKFVFEPNKNAAKIIMNETPLQVGLDNIYRSSETAQGYEILLRGYWADEGTFVVDYPYSLSGVMALGELGESEIRFAFAGDKVKVTAEQLVFGGEPIVVEGSR